MRVLVIAGTDLRRLVRWRANLFFLFVLPMLIILLLGAAFGGADVARIGVVGGEQGPLARHFVSALSGRPGTETSSYSTISSLERAVARGSLDAGVELPIDYERELRSGGTVVLAYFARPDSMGQQIRATLESVAADESGVVAAARLIVREQKTALPVALERSRTIAAHVPRVQVRLTAPDGARYAGTTGRFEGGASTQLLLFIFLNSLNGAAWLIETRRLGIARRILSTSTSVRTLVTGQLAGRLAIALLQALIIVLGSLLFFGVDWGNPLGTAAVVIAFSLVGAGAGLLLGSLFATEQQAGPVAVLLGLGLAALGGSMAPLEVFPDTARAVAHVTPHAWANDAFSKLLRHGGDLSSVLPEVGVLLLFAVAVLSLATWQLRRTLTAQG